MKIKDYMDQIINGELLDFWMNNMEELGDIKVMEDDTGYHMGAISRYHE
jgi:hypothetical protein